MGRDGGGGMGRVKQKERSKWRDRQQSVVSVDIQYDD